MVAKAEPNALLPKIDEVSVLAADPKTVPKMFSGGDCAIGLTSGEQIVRLSKDESVFANIDEEVT